MRRRDIHVGAPGRSHCIHTARSADHLIVFQGHALPKPSIATQQIRDCRFGAAAPLTATTQRMLTSVDRIAMRSIGTTTATLRQRTLFGSSSSTGPRRQTVGDPTTIGDSLPGATGQELYRPNSRQCRYHSRCRNFRHLMLCKVLHRLTTQQWYELKAHQGEGHSRIELASRYTGALAPRCTRIAPRPANKPSPCEGPALGS